MPTLCSWPLITARSQENCEISHSTRETCGYMSRKCLVTACPNTCEDGLVSEVDWRGEGLEQETAASHLDRVDGELLGQHVDGVLHRVRGHGGRIVGSRERHLKVA